MPQKDPSRTEKATPKRRKKARDEGNVPRSTELGKAVSILAGVLILRFLIEFLDKNIRETYLYFLRQSFSLELTRENVYHIFLYSSKQIGLMVLPIMFFVFLISLLVTRAQVGSLWTTKPLTPKFKNFNIIQGLKKIFVNIQTLINLTKSVLQAFFVGLAPYLVLKSELTENILPLFYASVSDIAAYILNTGFKVTGYALVPMLLIGVADLIYTRWDYEENLKMTKEEVKDERKQAEGDPQIKSKQKRKMLKVMQQRMLQEVPNADVVITNPTHIAVALAYNPLKAPAPIVLAKGANKVAEKIKEVARKHNVPIKENKPLAWALYKSVEIGETIPEELYRAVAAVLAQLYKYRKRK